MEGANFGARDSKTAERAPKEVVGENKKRREDFKARIAQLDEMLENLS